VSAPLTAALISGGYQQKSGGYIAYAKQCGIEEPTQYWHLIHSWSDNRNPEQPFGKSVVCGELIFWMAEVSGAVPHEELSELLNGVLELPNDRRRGNKLIQDACFDRLIAFVESTTR
jgi:hypothetical protein